MDSEVRPPTREEMPGYLRLLPYVNGMPKWEPADAAWHGGSEPWPAPPAPRSPQEIERLADRLMDDDTFHPVGVFEGGDCRGASGAISFEVTVPGGSQVPMAGVTATAVPATQRRRGHLRSMMQAMFDAALGRGEPLAMLSASEGSIYGRFGFAPVTYRTRWEIDRHEASLLPAPPDDGSLELVDAAVARRAWPQVHAVVSASRVGELTAPTGRWEGLSDEARGTAGPDRYLIHRSRDGVVDGVATFRLPWSATAEHAGTLVVEGLEATTPAAYRALWGLLLDVDLTRRVIAPGQPRDEPLRWMLANPRALRVTRQSDNLWARILDVPACLGSRAYGAQDSVVIRMTEDSMCPGTVGTWRLTADLDTAECSRTDGTPDVVLDIPALSALFMGGASASTLAYAGRLSADEAVVDRLDRLFRVDPEPHNSFAF